MKLRFWRKVTDIFVFGSAHVDIYGDITFNSDFDDKDIKKRLGDISFSLGGSGFNVALLLGMQGIKVVFSYLSNNRFFAGFLIKSEMKKIGVVPSPITSHLIPHLFYFALRKYDKTGMLSTTQAVCNDGSVEYPIPLKLLKKHIDSAKICVFCLSYKIVTFRDILSYAIFEKKRIILSGVGEQVVLNMQSIPYANNTHSPIDVFVLNDKELKSLLSSTNYATPEIWDNSVLPEILEYAFSILPIKVLIVTRGPHGIVVATRQGSLNFHTPELPPGRNVGGLGDAAVATTAKFLDSNLDFDESCEIFFNMLDTNFTIIADQNTANTTEPLMGKMTHLQNYVLSQSADRNRYFSIFLGITLMIAGIILGQLIIPLL